MLAKISDILYVYETESKLIVDLKLSFDLSKLKVFASNSFVKIIYEGVEIKEITLEEFLIDQNSAEIIKSKNFLRIQFNKIDDSIVELNFDKAK